MAQAFATTYDKAYQKKKLEKRKPCVPEEEVYNRKPVADFWIIEEDDSLLDKDAEFERKKKIVEKLYRDRLWTVYQVSYCKEQIAKETNTALPGAGVENEILEYGKRLFGKRTEKILKPMATSRKLYGYIRPTNMYTPFTEYQHVFSRLGYSILEKNHSRSKSAESRQL